MAKQVVWTAVARKQRQNILEYWANKNGNKEYSAKISYMIRNRIKYIVHFNYIGKETDFNKVRVSNAGHFSIFYKIHDKKIIIMSIWDNRQDPDKLVSFL